MRWFASIRIPGFGRLAPRIGAIGDRRGAGAAGSVWFWIGFLAVVWLVWKALS